ncbi:hypothetical protein DSO57_1004783 [Entomophthora muscae]|uniref:Uncharacterized protein n=1 Tax=Entomophthora muscae TaxID=34485 RepID=A0ACC2USY8_9FUNG|nr:hypothetical protein DSO57_1004783 [Entomophthora muscae]
MPSKLHEKQALSFCDIDLGVGILEYGDGPLEEYDVVRANETCKPDTALELSALDLYMPRNWMYCNYLFENTGNIKDFMSPEKLKTSLAKALDIIPALAGRLQCDDGSTGMNFMKPRAPTRILLNNKGAWFASTTMKTPFEEMRKKHLIGALIPSQFLFKRFLEAAIKSREQGVDAPLLAAKAVYFDCGSVSLTVYINHQVTDGCGMVEFARLWGQITRGVTPDPLVDSRHAINTIPKLGPKQAAEAQGRFLKHEKFKPLPTDMQLCKLTIPNKHLKKLKGEINAKLAPDYISSDDLFFSVHLRMILRARQPKTKVSYCRTINIRPSLGLDKSAFGNFVHMPLEGPFEPSTFVDEPLEKVALEIRNRLIGYTKDKMVQANKEYVSVETHSVPDQLDNYDCSRDIGCTSIAVYDPSRIDFQDSPAFVLGACYYISGGLTINHILDDTFNGTIPVDLSILESYKNDPEANKLGFTVTPLKKLLFD